MNKPLKIVVVGGGFAGLRLVRRLARDPDVIITLISDDENFRYSPALYRTATGHKRRESIVPIESIIAGKPNVRFIKAKLTGIDRAKRTITVQGGHTTTYDYCVLALGVVTSYFGIPGLEEYSYSIKSGREVDAFKKHLHQELIDEHKMDSNYIVVGAGPTGVEIAAALGQYLKRISKSHKIRKNKVHIQLIEAADRVLPNMHPRASKIAEKRLRKLHIKVLLNQRVQGETKNTLKVAGKSIPSKTVIWTAGVTNNPFFVRNSDQFEFDEKRRVKVDSHLRVDEHTFVIGDNCDARYGGLALSAVRNANYVAWFIKHSRHGHVTAPYWPMLPISVVPLGSKRAVFQWGRLVFDGLLADGLRLAADIVGYGDIMGYLRSARLWLARSDFEETCPICRGPGNIT